MNWWTMFVLLLGGLAMFLYGMNVMTEGLKAVAGNRMKFFLKSMTRNRWTSLMAGTGITAVIQSSSVTTVLAVGFVSAGLLSFQSTLGIILGANLGTTITAQIIAFKITKASWIMVAVGYLFSVLSKKSIIRHSGTIILGLGMVFLGMNVMSEGTAPLKNYEPFIALMQGLDNYIWGVLIGTIFTAAVQSSSATAGVVIVMASQGLISVEAGVSIILGANIGTCVTAVLSAINKPRAAMRVALSHVLFNVAGVLLWFGFIDQLANIVSWISINDQARQIAMAHTIFNIGNTVVFIWLVKPVSRLVLWIYPEEIKKPKELFPELHTYYLQSTAMAIDLVNASIIKLGEKTLTIISNGLSVALEGNSEALAKLREKDKEIDQGHAEILQFIQQIQSKSISTQEVELLERQIETVNILETAADLITTNLVEAAEHRISDGFSASDETSHKLKELHRETTGAFHLAISKYSGQPIIGGDQLSKMHFKDMFQEVRSHLILRLSSLDEMRIPIYRFESEVLEIIRSLHALARRFERRA